MARVDPAQRLIAGRIAGKADFSRLTEVVLDSPVLPLYPNPAAKNAAATGVELGRRLDLNA